MQKSIRPNRTLLLFRRLARAVFFVAEARRAEKPARLDGVPECGGYNELFIVSQWASYSTRR